MANHQSTTRVHLVSGSGYLEEMGSEALCTWRHAITVITPRQHCSSSLSHGEMIQNAGLHLEGKKELSISIADWFQTKERGICDQNMPIRYTST